MDQDSSADNKKPEWTKHDTSGGAFYGDQIMRGGGHFMGDAHFDLDRVIRALDLSPTSSAAPQPPVPDELSVAFEPLRFAAEQVPTVLPILDLLEQELRKGVEARDSVAAELIKVVVALCPQATAPLRTLLTVAPVAQVMGPITRTTIEQIGL